MEDVLTSSMALVLASTLQLLFRLVSSSTGSCFCMYWCLCLFPVLIFMLVFVCQCLGVCVNLAAPLQISELFTWEVDVDALENKRGPCDIKIEGIYQIHFSSSGLICPPHQWKVSVEMLAVVIAWELLAMPLVVPKIQVTRNLLQRNQLRKGPKGKRNRGQSQRNGKQKSKRERNRSWRNQRRWNQRERNQYLGDQNHQVVQVKLIQRKRQNYEHFENGKQQEQFSYVKHN